MWSEKDVIGSYVVFISAVGVVLFSIFIFRLKMDDKGETFGEFCLPDVFRTTRSTHRRFYMITTSTYVDQPTWDAIMDNFAEIWFDLYPGLHCELYLDYLHAHAHADTVLKARRKGIHIRLLPNTTMPGRESHTASMVGRMFDAASRGKTSKKVRARAKARLCTILTK